MPIRQQPGPGQESVWDYPRPPRLELTSHHIRIIFAQTLIAESRRAFRVLETSHPPVYYIPLADIQQQYLESAPGSSFCEYKGMASYYTVAVGKQRAVEAGWTYRTPSSPFEPIAGAVAFYASRMDECYVDDERVTPQPGGFYGGWITSWVVGPFKGGPGSWGW